MRRRSGYLPDPPTLMLMPPPLELPELFELFELPTSTLTLTLRPELLLLFPLLFEPVSTLTLALTVVLVLLLLLLLLPELFEPESTLVLTDTL
jgi:hypothetical protein